MKKKISLVFIYNAYTYLTITSLCRDAFLDAVPSEAQAVKMMRSTFLQKPKQRRRKDEAMRPEQNGASHSGVKEKRKMYFKFAPNT